MLISHLDFPRTIVIFLTRIPPMIDTLLLDQLHPLRPTSSMLLIFFVIKIMSDTYFSKYNIFQHYINFMSENKRKNEER